MNLLQLMMMIWLSLTTPNEAMRAKVLGLGSTQPAAPVVSKVEKPARPCRPC